MALSIAGAWAAVASTIHTTGEVLRQWAVLVAQEAPSNNSKLKASWFLSPQQVCSFVLVARLPR